MSITVTKPATWITESIGNLIIVEIITEGDTAMFVKVGNGTEQFTAVQVVKMRCPNCKRNGVFERVLDHDFLTADKIFCYGLRRCPDPECCALIFFVIKEGQLIASYPPEQIDFDSSRLPPPIVNALGEAVTCHAHQCYVAAGIMVRKTLEELCQDRGVKGNNLKDSINKLATTLLIPKGLVEGMDHLRLLGNDAAHIESKTYTQIGQEEIEVGIELTKEILKAVYQLDDLIDRLKALQKTENPDHNE